MRFRADCSTHAMVWVRELLRLASWRAVRMLQAQLAPEWQAVAVLPAADALTNPATRNSSPRVSPEASPIKAPAAPPPAAAPAAVGMSARVARE